MAPMIVFRRARGGMIDDLGTVTATVSRLLGRLEVFIALGLDQGTGWGLVCETRRIRRRQGRRGRPELASEVGAVGVRAAGPAVKGERSKVARWGGRNPGGGGWLERFARPKWRITGLFSCLMCANSRITITITVTVTVTVRVTVTTSLELCKVAAMERRPRSLDIEPFS